MSGMVVGGRVSLAHAAGAPPSVDREPHPWHGSRTGGYGNWAVSAVRGSVASPSGSAASVGGV